MKRILALTAGLLLLAATAFANDIDKGTIEIAGSSNGGFSAASGHGDTVTSLNLGLEGLYYLRPNIGVGALFNYVNLGGDADGSAFAIGPEAVYNFNLAEAMSAYAGVNVGYRSLDGDSNGLFAGASGGFKYFFTDAASVNCGLSLSRTFGDFDITTFGVNFGLSIFLM